MSKTVRLATVTTLLALLPLAAGGQGLEEADLALAYGDKDFVMIATGNSTPIAKAPSTASVITAEDIKALGATDLDQVLETVPGLHVSRSGSQWLPIYSMRGILTQYNPEVLVMVNGIPITSGYVGDRGRMWGDFPLENIARIEVIRGPGSALYGAEAVSGVINIITKTAGDIDGTEFGVRAGSFQSYDAWVQHGGKWGGFDTAVYLRLGTTDGFGGKIAADAQTGLDDLFGTPGISHAPGPLNVGFDAIDMRLDLSRDKWRLRAGYKGRRDIGTGAGVADALDPSKVDGRYFNTDLTWHDASFSKDWDLSAQATYSDLAETNDGVTLFPVGSFLPIPIDNPSTIGMVGRPQHWERQTRLNLSALYTGFEKHKLRFGAGYFKDDLYKVTESKNFTFVGLAPFCINADCSMVDATGDPLLAFLAPHKRTSAYVYAQDEWSLAPDWYLTAGVRYDNYSDFGSTTNPRIALVWDAAYDLTGKLMFGRAFRAPSFVEQHTVNNPLAWGNPDLKPETIDMLELAFSWQPAADLQTGLSLYRYRMDDVIRFLPNADPTTGSTAQNAGSQRGSGAELELTWDAANNLRLAGNYAWQRSIDEATGRDAGLAPHHQLYARADWRFKPGWTLNGQANWVIDRERQFGDNRPQIDDYATVDLTLRADRLAKGWEAAVSVRNLFDADAREPTAGASAANIPNDLPLPGRSLYLELRYQQ